MSWDAFTITLTNGTTITEAPEADGPGAPECVYIEPYGVEIHGDHADIVTDHPHYKGVERVNRRPDGTFSRPKNGDGFSRRYR
ncbi:hypothetical protein [Streptacidiphilus carbonis]|uniref:hypothetical protein n=1 Tax=Streptacidiphilus carbonis TaxID=105422 RepID=UPI0005AA160E|nr:hypothetical protein [Streptacidiphilus carbonis]